MIRKGQRVWIRPEWCDATTDNTIERVALEDEDDRGRIAVVCLIGWFINPQRIESVEHLITTVPQ